MRVSARCDYACRALLELTLHWPDTKPLHIGSISKRQAIPMKYLVQILIQLKRIGLVASSRGKEGGYILAKDPGTISLGEVMRSIGGPFLPVADSAKKKKAVFARIWNEVESAMARVLDKIDFEDIAKRAKGIEGAITYQI